MPKLKPIGDLKFSVSGKNDIMKQVAEYWPEFRGVPEDEKWPVAMWTLGANVPQISHETGMGEEMVEAMVKRYEGLVLQVPAGLRAEMNVLMLWRACGTLLSVATNTDKIMKLDPVEATNLLMKQLPMIKDFASIGDMLEARARGDRNLGLSGLSSLIDQKSSTGDTNGQPS
jgi:hypothetical protein